MSGHRLRWRGRPVAADPAPPDPRAEAVPTESGVWVAFQGRTAYFELDRRETNATGSAIDPEVRAPMTGKVVAVRVKAGDAVKENDVLAVLEAMKMEYRLAAPAAGRVVRVLCKPGDGVDLGQPLVVLEFAS